MEIDNFLEKKISRRRFLRTSLAGVLSIPAIYKIRLWAGETSANQVAPVHYQNSTDVLFYQRDDADYAAYRQPFNRRITLMPRVIAVCLSEKGVQEAIRLAHLQKLSVVVKSGGHSFEGFCLNDNGMVVDLSRINGMSYDVGSGRFIVGPGSKLGIVYEYLAQYNRLIPAGSCASVGIGGLTLGGGYGFFSRQFGLTCDSLLRVRLVDAQGKLYDSDQNRELLWACRGGGNGSLGIVTSMEFATHPAPTKFASYRFRYTDLTTSQAAKLLERWFHLMKMLPRSSFSAFVLGPKTLAVLVTDMKGSPESELSQILTELRMDASKISPPRVEEPIAALKHYTGSMTPLFFKNVSAGFYTDYDDLRGIFNVVHQEIKKQAGMLLQINTLGGAIADIGLEKTAAYPHRRFSFLGELQVYWKQPTQEVAAVNSVRYIQQKLYHHGIHSHYSSYPDIDLPKWQEAYYGVNYERLQALKRQLDPDNLICHPQSIMPAKV